MMKTIADLNARKAPIVRIDASLDQYRDQTPFPAKLAKANEMLKTATFPARRQRS